MFRSSQKSDRAGSHFTGRLSQFEVFATIAVLLASTSLSLAAVFPGYQFLTVAGNFPLNGNATQTTFSGTNGVIKVTHNFPNGGVGVSDNDNNAISPSQFTTMFPGTGTVQGHLAQTVYAHTSVVTFDMTGYTITPDTAFGIWNTTDEVTAPAGGNPVYRVQLLDSSNLVQNPSTFSYMGNQDNQTQVQGRHSLVMNTGTGEITFGGTINGGIGTHTDAAFWRRIPFGTKQINVYADLPQLNTIGDGVGYYFAELKVPEPATIAFTAPCLLALLLNRRRQN
jgi:hypothetical protein